MTAYILLVFLLTPDGNVVARGDNTMYVGFDLCDRMREERIADLKANNSIMKYHAVCVDSKIFPGRES